MDKRVAIILIVVILLVVAGVAGVLYYLNTQTTPVVVPSPTPISTPSVNTQTQAALTAAASTPLSTSEAGMIDIFLDTKLAKIDGFQFIATVGGGSLPTIPDADTATDGIQIMPATIPELAISTNSVTEQDGTFIVRFAMIAQDSTTGYSTTGPVKVASIPVSSGTGGSISLAFNQQNSRVRLTSGGDDALLGVTDATIPVTTTASVVATDSGSLVSQAVPTATPIVSTVQSSTVSSPFCLAACVTDSDCAAGLACETDRCVNPACPTSQTCGCGASALATPLATTSPLVTASPFPTATALATVVSTAEPIAMASESGELPASGSFEYTLLTLGAGLLLIGGGVFMTARQEA